MVERFDRYQEQAAHDFSEWAAEHAAASEGKLVVIENNPAKYEAQRLRVNTIHGTPLSPEMIELIAVDVDPRYEGISASCEKAEMDSKRITAIGETLKSGDNVVLGTDHMELLDIALLLAKVSAKLKINGYEFETAILFNKMVAWLGHKSKRGVVPLTELVSLAYDLGYMSVPGTDSSKSKLTLPRKIIQDYNNGLVNLSIQTRMNVPGTKPLLIGIAFPGTVNKPLDVEAFLAQPDHPDIPEEELHHVMVIGRASEGVTKITKHAMTMLASAHLNGDSAEISFANTLYRISNQKELNAAMGTIAVMQSAADSEHIMMYDADKKLPVKKAS